jgi:hypothetical protein
MNNKEETEILRELHKQSLSDNDNEEQKEDAFTLKNLQFLEFVNRAKRNLK